LELISFEIKIAVAGAAAIFFIDKYSLNDGSYAACTMFQEMFFQTVKEKIFVKLE
jgi:hypothetical protein